MSWEAEADLYLGLPQSASAPNLLRRQSLPKLPGAKLPSLEPTSSTAAQLASHSGGVLFDGPHGLAIPGWSMEETRKIGQRLAAEEEWRRLGSKLWALVAMRTFADEGGWTAAKQQAGHSRLLQRRKEAEGEVSSTQPQEGGPRMDMSNRFGAVPTSVRDEFDAVSLWKSSRLRITRSRALIRPLSPLEIKAGRAYAASEGPPIPVSQSSIRFDRSHHGQARRAKLALKQLEDDPVNAIKQGEFRNSLAELSRTRYVIAADVERGGASVYPDEVWGVQPERIQAAAARAGRFAWHNSSGIEFSVSYNRHRGANITTQALKMPSPRRAARKRNVHKLLPDSHFALGAFNADESDPLRFKREEAEKLRMRYYKQGNGAYQTYLLEHPPTPPPEEDEDEDNGAEKVKLPQDDWAPGGAFHHLIFGGPSDDEVMRMLTGEPQEESDDELDWLGDGVGGVGSNAARNGCSSSKIDTNQDDRVLIIVPPTLRAVFGDQIELPLRGSVGDLRATAASVFGVQPSELAFAHDDLSLDDDGVMLAQAGIPNRGVISASLRGSAANTNPFIVTVDLPPSMRASHVEALTVATSRDATMGSVMALLESLTGLRVNDQELSFHGSVLTEQQTNGSAGITSGSRLSLRLKNAGGGDSAAGKSDAAGAGAASGNSSRGGDGRGDSSAGHASGNGGRGGDGRGDSSAGHASGNGGRGGEGRGHDNGSRGAAGHNGSDESALFNKAFGSSRDVWSSVDAGIDGDPAFEWLDRSFWRARKHGPRPCESRDFVDTRQTLKSGFWSVWKGTSGYTCLTSDEDGSFGRAFSYAKIEKEAVKLVASTLEKWYPMLVRIYTYYSCIGADVTNCVEGLSLAGFALLISDAKLDIEAEGRKARFARTRGEDGWDLLWVSVNSSKESVRQAKEEGFNSANRFIRGEFLEFIARASSLSSTTPPDELPKAVEMFCEDLLIFLSDAPDGANVLHRADQFRREFCYMRETASMLDHHKETLRNVFKVYAEKGTGGAEMDQGSSIELMSAAEWFALLRDLGMVKECGVRTIYLTFALSRMAVVHESNNASGQLTQLTFEGFCEAIVRLSLIKALPTDKEMKKANFQYPGEYIGAILDRGLPMYESWVQTSKRNFELDRADPVFRRVDMLILLIVSVMQVGGLLPWNRPLDHFPMVPTHS